MARITPLSREQLAEFEPLFQTIEKSMGFVPNSLLTLGRRPAILRGFAQMAIGVYGAPGEEMPITSELMRLIAHVASRAAGCRYCQAHTAAEASRFGGTPDRVEAVWEFETSPLFNDAERAALRLALAAGSVPNAATDEHFEELRRYYSEEQIVHIMAVIALFGFLNRWNDTVATTLETEPLHFAQTYLARSGWEAGKHAGT
jgi:uncharacterized peroxidase-related enzyme